MPRLSLGLSLPRTRSAGGFTPKRLSGLSLWLKADAGVTVPTSGPYTYVSQIVISGSNTPNVNGTYTATSVPTFDESGNPNDYNLVGPSYTIEWNHGPSYFYLQTGGFSEYWTSSDGVNWAVVESITDTITISGSETPNVNGVYTYSEPNYYGPTYVIENYNGFQLLDQGENITYYTASSANGPWTIVNGSGAITSTTTLAPRGSITATKVVSSSAVTAWADQSGNGRNVYADGATIPSYEVISGKQFISFEGSDSLIGSNGIWPDGNDIDNGTIIAVVRFPSSSSATGASSIFIHESALYFRRGKPYGDGLYGTIDDSNIVEGNSNLGNNTNYLVEMIFNIGGGFCKIYLNGSESGSVVTYGANGGANFFIGQGEDPFSMAEIIVYNRVLTTPERQQVEAYLNTKYAIY